MKNRTWPQLFIIYLRYLLGFAFVFSSIVKIQGLRFTFNSGAENPIDSAWHFFETLYASGLYWKFLGLAQFTAGALLLTQRYAKLGLILFLPIIANIFVITISYDFNGTPIITGLMLIATLFLLYWDWDILKVLVNKAHTEDSTKRLEHDSLWALLGIIFLICTTATRLLFKDETIIFGFLVLFLVGIIGFFVGYSRRNRYFKVRG